MLRLRAGSVCIIYKMVLIAAAASKTARDEKKRHKTLFYTRTLTHSLNTLVAGVWVCFFCVRSFVRLFFSTDYPVSKRRMKKKNYEFFSYSFQKAMEVVSIVCSVWLLLFLLLVPPALDFFSILGHE